MTLQINIAGTDRAYAVRLVGSSGGEGFHTESAAMAGTVSSGLIEVEDPDGSLELLGWRGFNIVETTATPTRIATGFLANIDQTAGPFRVGPGRVHRCETVDLNWELTRIAIESGGKRPAETDLARVTWLLGNNSLSGRVYAGALTDLTNNPVNLGEADFTDEYPIDVLTDLCPVAGKTAYVTWDFTNNRAQLFYDLTNTTTFDSPAAISDGPGDADDSTVFAPRNDPVLHRVIEDGYSDIWLRYKNGLVHKHDATFQTDHGRRDLVLSTSRIGNPATADAYATKAMNAHNHETTSLDCEVEVPAAHVNDILEGHRLYFKSTHLTGFTSYAYTRVERRTVRQVDDQSRRFIIGLQLSDRVLSALPGGPPPSDFPHQTGPLTIIQQSDGLSTRTFSTAPTDSDVLVLLISNRSGAPGVPTGYTDSGEGAVTGGADYVRGLYRVASGDGTSIAAGTLDTAVGWYELSPGATLTYADSNTGSSLTASLASFSVPAGGIAFAVMGLGTGGGFDAGGYNDPFAWTAPAGWVKDLNQMVNSGHPSTGIFRYANTTGSAASLSPSFTFFDNGEGPEPWQIIVMVFGPSATSGPPSPGQWVYGEVVTLTAGAGTTAFPFADGSLHVRYDIVDQTAAIVSYDGATGAFQMPSQPPLGTQVFVDYQGR